MVAVGMDAFKGANWGNGSSTPSQCSCWPSELGFFSQGCFEIPDPCSVPNPSPLCALLCSHSQGRASGFERVVLSPAVVTTVCARRPALMGLGDVRAAARFIVALSPLQTEALQQLQKDSEAIRSQYAHYFDLSLVNNGVDETLKRLQEAFEQACSSPQWVPVSWVY